MENTISAIQNTTIEDKIKIDLTEIGSELGGEWN
jgi:hypothetical protein